MLHLFFSLFTVDQIKKTLLRTGYIILHKHISHYSNAFFRDFFTRYTFDLMIISSDPLNWTVEHKLRTAIFPRMSRAAKVNSAEGCGLQCRHFCKFEILEDEEGGGPVAKICTVFGNQPP